MGLFITLLILAIVVWAFTGIDPNNDGNYD